MGVQYANLNRTAEKQNYKSVENDKALLRLALKEKDSHTPEELALMEKKVQGGDFIVRSGWFTSIRHRNLQGFKLIGELLRNREENEGQLTRKLTKELKKELRCWAQNNAELQELPSYFHPAHLLQTDLDPTFRALQLGYLYLAVLGQRAYYQQQGLLDEHGKPTPLLQERIHRASKESALSPYLDTDRGPLAYPLSSLPEKPWWERGAIQSLYLDYLTDSLVLAASQSGLEFGGGTLSPYGGTTQDYISKTLTNLGERLDRHIADRRAAKELP